MIPDISYGPAQRRKLRHAAGYFSSGRFTEAEALFTELAEGNPERPDVLSRLGHLALLSNRMDDAIQYLAAALRINSRAVSTWNLLAEAYYRKGEFGSAAYCYNRIKRREQAVTLAAMAELTPNRLEGVGKTISLPWIAADPLPVVSMQINGIAANFVLDTGAGDLVLDQNFAVSAGVALGTREQRRFAGGISASVQYGHVKTMDLDGASLHDLLVQVLPLEAVFAPYFTRLPIHGILGTTVYSKFTTTLDYRERVLHLRPLGQLPKEHNRMQFWIAGSHYIVLCGKISKYTHSLMFLDSGMAGTACAIPPSTADMVKAISIGNTPLTGHGGGGAVRGRPVRLNRVSLGTAYREDVEGILLEDFPLELQFGFRIGGLIAHDFLRGRALTLDFDAMYLTLT